MKIVCWNTAFKRQPWFDLAEMKDIDVALLQETCTPPREVLGAMEFSPYSPCWASTFTSIPFVHHVSSGRLTGSSRVV